MRQGKSWVPALVIALGLTGPSYVAAQKVTFPLVLGQWAHPKDEQPSIFTFRPDSVFTYDLPTLGVIATGRWSLAGDTVVVPMPMMARMKDDSTQTFPLPMDLPVLILFDKQQKPYLTTKSTGAYYRVDGTGAQPPAPSKKD